MVRITSKGFNTAFRKAIAMAASSAEDGLLTLTPGIIAPDAIMIKVEVIKRNINFIPLFFKDTQRLSISEVFCSMNF